MSKNKKKRDKKRSSQEPTATSATGNNFLKSLGQFSQQRLQRNTRAASIHIPRKPK